MGGLPASYTLEGPPEMMTPLRPVRAAAGVSLGATSAYTPSSRTLRAMRWQYCPPASRTVIWGVKFHLNAHGGQEAHHIGRPHRLLLYYFAGLHFLGVARIR